MNLKSEKMLSQQERLEIIALIKHKVTPVKDCTEPMAVAMFPVMSNSGSGNQGIAATLPVSVFAEETDKPEEELIRA